MPTYFASLAVRCRRRTLVPKVRPSISSVAVAKTFPALTRAAQLASASHGAYDKPAKIIIKRKVE